MSTTLDEQINQIGKAIADLEAQMQILSDEAVEASQILNRKMVVDFQVQAESQSKEPVDIPHRKQKIFRLLFMDVVGSKFMPQHLIPEDNLELMENVLLGLGEPIQENGSRITQYSGDGFKPLFDNPVAIENVPEQALRAGLKILEVSRVLAEEIKKNWGIKDFDLQVDIDTGLASLGEQTGVEKTVRCRVVNLRARIV